MRLEELLINNYKNFVEILKDIQRNNRIIKIKK
jgi:hypothetical protein